MCHKKDKFEVERAMLELYNQTLTAFGQEDTEDMLDQDALKKIKSTHSTEINHSKRLISLSGNPQGPSDSLTTTRPHKKHTHITDHTQKHQKTIVIKIMTA